MTCNRARCDHRALAAPPQLLGEADRALADAGKLRRLRDQIDGFLAQRERPRRWNEATALDALNAYRAEHGRWPRKVDLTGHSELPSYGTLRGLFGGLPAAVYEAEGCARSSYQEHTLL